MTVVTLEALGRALSASAPVDGTIQIRYWIGHLPAVDVSGATVTFPDPITVNIVDGDPASSLDLVPTGGVSCVRWDIRSGANPTLTRYTSIPASGPVDFGDLTEVDPTSFAPTTATPSLLETIDTQVAAYLVENPPTATAAWGSVTGTLSAQTDLDTALSGKATAAQGALADTATQPGDLSTVATTGAYSDLSGTPTLGTAAATAATDYATAAQGALADTATQPGDLATVGTTGDYDDLINKPTLGTAAATASTAYATAAQGALADSATQPGDLSTVATTGAYDDLSGKPTLGTAAATASTDYATAAQGATADTAVQPGDLGAVATSNDYDDLTNLPTLGTAAATAATAYATAAQGALADSATQPGDLGDLAGKDQIVVGDVDATGTPSATTFYRGDGTWSTPAGSGDMSAATYDPTAVAGDAFAMDNMVEGTNTKILTSAERTSIGTATQPGDLATVGTTGDYADLINKPTLGTAAATAATDYATAAQGALADSATQPGDLSTVATTGAYSDLTGKPTLGTAAATAATDYATAAQGALADSATQPGDLSTVATTGAYSDLTGKPTLGTAAATASTDYATAAQGALADSATQPGDLATVGTSGDYADLINKPTLGTAAATASTDYATAAQGATADTAIQPATVDAKGDLLAATAADTVTRLAVGTNNQVLTADSAQATGVKWADAVAGADGDSAYQVWLDEGNSGTEQDFLDSLVGADGATGAAGVSGFVGPGRYAGEYIFNAVSGGNIYNATTPVVGTLYCTPLYNFGPAFDVDRIVIQNGAVGASGAVARLGAYEVGSDGRIGDLLFDAGTVDMTTGGDKSITITETIPQGVVLLVMVVNDAACRPRFIGSSRTRNDGWWRGETGPIQNGEAWISYTGYSAGSSLPATGTTAGETLQSADCPMIAVRVA